MICPKCKKKVGFFWAYYTVNKACLFDGVNYKDKYESFDKNKITYVCPLCDDIVARTTARLDYFLNKKYLNDVIPGKKKYFVLNPKSD